MIPIWYFHQVNYFILEKNTLEIETLSCLTSKIWGFEFEFQPSKVNTGQNYFCCSKAHITISYSIFDLNVFRVWPLTSKSHLGLKKLYHSKAHIWLLIWLLWTPSLYLVPFTSYWTPKCLRFDLDHWTLEVIWYLVSKKFIPSESPYMTFYLTSIDNISVSRTVFEKFDFEVFMVCPWPLTPKGHLGSKCFIAFESPYMTSYLTSMDNISQFRTVFEIFDFKVFRVWPWPLTPESPPGSKILTPFESPYTTSYLTSMDTISLSRTALEIFNFKVFRVWPWFLTPKGHRGSKNFISFWSPYMTSYLTSMDAISLSRTVLEIFDFKVFRVWPWHLTPKGHRGSKKINHLEAHIWLPIWLLWTPSLYLVPF